MAIEFIVFAYVYISDDMGCVASGMGLWDVVWGVVVGCGVGFLEWGCGMWCGVWGVGFPVGL